MKSSTPSCPRRPQRLGLAAAVGGGIATLLTAAACAGPLVAISLGIGGFGWLARYATLRVPASIATLVMLALGFWLARRECQPSRVTTVFLYAATALAVVVNVFEYVVFPTL